MPRKTPKLGRHKPTGRAYVRLDGRQIYLGEYGTAQAVQRYHRLLAEYAANGYTLPDTPPDLSVAELAAQYLEHARAYYVYEDGSPTGELERIRTALTALVGLYGDDDARDFGPRKLDAVRHEWIAEGRARTTCNAFTRLIKRAFRWAASQELIPGSVWQDVSTLPGLAKGRTSARETQAIGPVGDAAVDAVLPHVSPQVSAMIRLQLLSGMRPGEVVDLRPQDLDTTGAVWIARLAHHKNAWRGSAREIFFGPRAQDVIRPFLNRPLDAPLFSPAEAETQRHKTGATGARREGQPDNPRETDRRIGHTYTVASYRRAIHRGCDAAGIERWSPNRLRHSCATRIKRTHGDESARLALGHTNADTTQLYIERDRAQALALFEEIG